MALNSTGPATGTAAAAGVGVDTSADSGVATGTGVKRVGVDAYTGTDVGVGEDTTGAGAGTRTGEVGRLRTSAGVATVREAGCSRFGAGAINAGAGRGVSTDSAGTGAKDFCVTPEVGAGPLVAPNNDEAGVECELDGADGFGFGFGWSVTTSSSMEKFAINALGNPAGASGSSTRASYVGVNG